VTEGPNTRMQRTRLRSPLMRSPLGAAKWLCVAGLVTLATDCEARGPQLACRVIVPAAYRGVTIAEPSEDVRYTRSYEAFWWNCVSLRAATPDARCPFVCSGTPAEAQGCRDGAQAAEEGISQLVREHSVERIQAYLRSLASRPEAKDKMLPYFSTPTPERLSGGGA